MFMFPLQNPVYKLCPRPLLAAGPGVGDRPGDGRGHAAAGRGGTQLRTPITSRGYRGEMWCQTWQNVTEMLWTTGAKFSIFIEWNILYKIWQIESMYLETLS